MAQILDILNIQPNKISTDLTSYNFLLYSMPGIGKTSLAVSLFPEKHFILGAEYGFKGIPGAIGVAVPDYFSLNQYVKQLDTVEARERFDTIIVDTTSKIGSMIEEYVLSQYGKNFLGDCKQHGGAYPLINRYYDLAFNKLKARGYNFVYICHANETSVTNEEGLVSNADNLWSAGPDSGKITFTIAGQMGTGNIVTNGLESSNVDLARELSNMIIAQRAINANSRVFSTASSVLETLSQLGR